MSPRLLAVFILTSCLLFAKSAVCDPHSTTSNPRRTPAAQHALDYLAHVMDQYHNGYDVYTDDGAAGNHFLALPRMSNQDDARQPGAEVTVPAMNEASTDHPHSGLTCIKASFQSQETGCSFNWGAWYFMNGYQANEAQPGLLTTGDLSEPTCLALELRDNHDPISRSLYEGLSPATQQQLKNWQSTQAPSELLMRLLVDDLNRLLTASDFPGTITNEQSKSGTDRTTANRKLLENFYPVEIAKSSSTPIIRPNWGDQQGAGIDLRRATKLTFWARGEKGGERVEFFALGVGRDPDNGKPQDDPNTNNPFGYPDSSPKVSIGYQTLSSEWKHYSINLRRKDLKYVLGGFGWAASATENGLRNITFYLDDISYDGARLDEPRFLVSYETINSQNEFDTVSRNTAHTYDNALALLAFLAAGETGRAKLIADAFVAAQQNDRYYKPGNPLYGGLRNAYEGGDLFQPAGWPVGASQRAVRMPGWYVSRTDDSALFQMGDIRNIGDLRTALLPPASSPDARDPFCQYLWSQIPPQDQERIAHFDPAEEPSLQQVMIDALNSVITRGTNLYKEAFSSPNDLASPLRGRAQTNTNDLDLVRLNRLLLEAKYPQYFAQRAPQQWMEDEYDVSLNTGNIAWVMIALLAYHEIAIGGHNSPYLTAAKDMGNWVVRNCTPKDGSDGFTAGFEGWEPNPKPLTYKATEHNIDLYAAFERLYQITNDPVWQEKAESAKHFVLSQAWDPVEGKFWTGTTGGTDDSNTINKDVIPVDIQAWAILSFREPGNPHEGALEYAQYMKLGQGYGYSGGYDYSRKRILGTDQYQPPAGVWYEGTAQMATAFHFVGDKKEQLLLTFLESKQLPSGGMPASDQINGLLTGFQSPDGEYNRYFMRTHVGATAWLVLAELGVNPFWLGDTQRQ